MRQLAHVGDLLAMYARMCPDKIGAGYLEREMTFCDWYVRACQLANALLGIDLDKGDRVCVLAPSSINFTMRPAC